MRPPSYTIDTYGHMFPGHDEEQLAALGTVISAAIS
jgi:hypothetical protein